MKTNLILLFVLLFTPILGHAQKTKKNSPKKEKLLSTLIVCDGDSIPEGYSIIDQSLEVNCVKKNRTGKAFTISTSGSSTVGSTESATAFKPIKQQEDAAAKVQRQKALIEIADNLSSCTKYKTTFVHPFVKKTYEKEILGIIDGKCNYVEQMPAGVKMECKYSESERKSVAQYLKDYATAKHVVSSVHYDSINGARSVDNMDGKEVVNPIQEAMNNKVCVITGYPADPK